MRHIHTYQIEIEVLELNNTKIQLKRKIQLTGLCSRFDLAEESIQLKTGQLRLHSLRNRKKKELKKKK